MHVASLSLLGHPSHATPPPPPPSPSRSNAVFCPVLTSLAPPSATATEYAFHAPAPDPTNTGRLRQKHENPRQVPAYVLRHLSHRSPADALRFLQRQRSPHPPFLSCVAGIPLRSRRRVPLSLLLQLCLPYLTHIRFLALSPSLPSSLLLCDPNCECLSLCPCDDDLTIGTAFSLHHSISYSTVTGTWRLDHLRAVPRSSEV